MVKLRKTGLNQAVVIEVSFEDEFDHLHVDVIAGDVISYDEEVHDTYPLDAFDEPGVFVLPPSLIKEIVILAEDDEDEDEDEDEYLDDEDFDDDDEEDDEYDDDDESSEVIFYVDPDDEDEDD